MCKSKFWIWRFWGGIKLEFKNSLYDIVIQKQRLRVSINMKYTDIYDPKGLCKDITGLGRWGNGDAELFFEHTSDIDDVMAIIEQSYNNQSE